MTLIREVGYAFGSLRDTMYGNKRQACTARLWGAVGPENMIGPHTKSFKFRRRQVDEGLSSFKMHN